MKLIDKNRIIDSISKILPELKIKYKVKSLSIFGSVVRGEATQESDIDVLVDFKNGADLLDLMAVGNLLEEYLGRKVDVVSRSGLRNELKSSIEQESESV